MRRIYLLIDSTLSIMDDLIGCVVMMMIVHVVEDIEVLDKPLKAHQLSRVISSSIINATDLQWLIISNCLNAIDIICSIDVSIVALQIN